MSSIYREGLDANGQWEIPMGNLALERNGAIVSLGQVPPAMKRQLDRIARAGTLVKYRGHWNTLSPVTGTGPLKTIWALPEIAEAAGVA